MSSFGRTQEEVAKRRKELFGDCALVEIIHLHDCLRGALRELQKDVTALSRSILQQNNGNDNSVANLEKRVAGRFKVIWSVFRAHSAAEDEFIWPALRSKTDGGRAGSPHDEQVKPHTIPVEVEINGDEGSVDQEEYEEDHADEERMFRRMDELLAELRHGIVAGISIKDMVKAIDDLALSLSKHLYAHLEKEETQCMPLVVKHLTKSEITDLVGQIMGKRSSDTIAQIMTMAVQNLNENDRNEMVVYMKQAMVGTFFEKWLAMSGWMDEKKPSAKDAKPANEEDQKMGKVGTAKRPLKPDNLKDDESSKRFKTATNGKAAAKTVVCLGSGDTRTCATCESSGVCLAAGKGTGDVTSQAELEKLIRAIVSNPELGPVQKQTTIQGLRDSVFKSNLRATGSAVASAPVAFHTSLDDSATTTATLAVAPSTRSRRITPASSYYKKNRNGEVELVWSSESASQFPHDDKTIPLFSASELAPTYHDGANGAVLGCPHYARACKLRHPSSGRLYTCRLCCEQEREMPMKDKDSPLDRYAVTEVLCMRCGALQPASDRCVNPKCDPKPFAKYSCRICSLYDDNPNHSVYHCPYCNVCRLGLGLGIDYRHCMRCNACVSLEDDEHQCVPQKLQGTCPICHDGMFESTEPLRGLKCGHVMHMSCFSMYVRGQNFTCPLCKKSIEDMTEYFALLDAAVRMQPMPTAYTSTISNIYCQDCNETGQTQYHFVGCKCPHCGSYNTRELGRMQNR
jgi:hypothetical protein